jgi:hypothetical protein
MRGRLSPDEKTAGETIMVKTPNTAEASPEAIASFKTAAECHEKAAACHEQAAEQHRAAASLYAACDHMKAKQHVRQAAEYSTQAQNHGVQALHHSHEIEVRYSGPDIVSPAVGHLPLGQTSKM